MPCCTTYDHHISCSSPEGYMYSPVYAVYDTTSATYGRAHIGANDCMIIDISIVSYCDIPLCALHSDDILGSK